MKIKVGGKEYDVDDAVGLAFKKMKDELQAKMKKMDEINADLLDRLEKNKSDNSNTDEDKFKKEKMELTAKVDALEKELAEFNDEKKKTDGDAEFMKKVAEYTECNEHYPTCLWKVLVIAFE